MTEPSDAGLLSDRVLPALTIDVRRLRRAGLLVTGIGAVVCAVHAALDPTRFLRSYLIAFAYWIFIALGCLAILMLQHVAPGGWGAVLRRPLEAASRTIAPMGLLFIPVLIGLPHLYEWAHPGAAATSAVIAHKAQYLNIPFFIARAVLYFAVWGGLARWLSRMSAEQDVAFDPTASRRVRKVSAVGLVLYVVTVTLASIDWLMSLQIEWYSTIYGISMIGGQAVSAMAFAILVALWLSSRPPAFGLVRPRHFHDFGKMLLAFVMLWAYFAISQLLVIWAGNLPEEVPFYIDRVRDGWRWVSLALVLFHFALPFLLLLSRDLKRDGRRLAGVAGLLLVMRWVDLYWQIAPAFHGEVHFHWIDLVTLATLGAAFMTLFARELASRPVLAIREPRLKGALDHD